MQMQHIWLNASDNPGKRICTRHQWMQSGFSKENRNSIEDCAIDHRVRIANGCDRTRPTPIGCQPPT
jgi:hypothetical protein